LEQMAQTDQAIFRDVLKMTNASLQRAEDRLLLLGRQSPFCVRCMIDCLRDMRWRCRWAVRRRREDAPAALPAERSRLGTRQKQLSRSGRRQRGKRNLRRHDISSRSILICREMHSAWQVGKYQAEIASCRRRSMPADLQCGLWIVRSYFANRSSLLCSRRLP
jgi:hypothetical protein